MTFYGLINILGLFLFVRNEGRGKTLNIEYREGIE